jgi:hypothetical protein
MGTNRKLIKCHGKSEGLSHAIFEQAQGYSLWDSLLEGEVMLQTPPSPVIYIIACTNIVACIIPCIIACTNIIIYIIAYIIVCIVNF